jgi:DNA-binding response OmpR family regulator
MAIEDLPLVADIIECCNAILLPDTIAGGSHFLVSWMHRLQVLEASRLEEAEALCRRHPEEINLLITDVVMTDMMGRKLAAEIARIQPGIKILFTTGYADEAMHGTRTLQSGEAFIQKPFTPGVFIRRVRELLRPSAQSD